MNTRKKNSRILFWGFAIFVLLRVFGLLFELPIMGSVPDEDYYSNVILRGFSEKTLELNFFWYPSFFFYLNLMVFHVGAFLMKGLAFLIGVQRTGGQPLDVPLFQSILIHGRVMAVIWGSLLTLVVYRIAGHLFQDKRLQYLAFFLCGLNSQLIIYSHVNKPDMLQALLVSLTILTALTLYQKKSLRYFYLSVFLAGLAMGTKLLGGTVIVVPVLSLLFISLENRRIRSFFFHGFMAFLLWIGTFLVTTPFIILQFDKARNVLGFYQKLAATDQYAYLYRQYFQRFLEMIKILYTTPEILLLVVGIVVTAFILVRYPGKRAPWSMILTFFLLYTGLGYVKNFLDTRYYFPAVSAAIMLTVAGTGWLTERLRNRKLQGALILLLLAIPVVRAARTSMVFGRPTTQSISYQYVENRVPRETAFAYELMCGVNLRKNRIFQFNLGKMKIPYYRQSDITFVVHNANMYDMYFSLPSGRKELPLVYKRYHWIFDHTLCMKEVHQTPQVDFLNPRIRYLKFVDTGEGPPNARLHLQGRVENPFELPLYLMSGNRVLGRVRPMSGKDFDKSHDIRMPRGRSIFLFYPVYPGQKAPERDEISASCKLDIIVSQESGERLYHSLKVRIKPNEPVIRYLKNTK